LDYLIILFLPIDGLLLGEASFSILMISDVLADLASEEVSEKKFVDILLNCDLRNVENFIFLKS
jgi:hypothetical protein